MVNGQHSATELVFGPDGPMASARAAVEALRDYEARGGGRELVEAMRVAQERAAAHATDLRTAMENARERSKRA